MLSCCWEIKQCEDGAKSLKSRRRPKLSAAFRSEIEGREVLFSVWCFRIDTPAHVCWQRMKQWQRQSAEAGKRWVNGAGS